MSRFAPWPAGCSSLVLWLAILLPAALADEIAQPRSPAQIFGQLYGEVEQARVFPDSKTFADATPRRAVSSILADYAAGRPFTHARLEAFVRANFTVPSLPVAPATAAGPPVLPLMDHIKALWRELARPPVQAAPNSSQLSLAFPFVVPGGRFREVYYWDSYFTMLGLVKDGETVSANGLVANFADLIARYGHVPNGARTYYLSRSQPPVFYLMVGLIGEPSAYLGALRAEYAFWMHGAEGLGPGQAREHVVRMPDGSLLARYWDARDGPRDESWYEDQAIAATSHRPAAGLYRDLRSAAESGWDFSSRWLRNADDLSTIETTSIVPVDLNSLLYGLERAISAGCDQHGATDCSREFSRRAERRHRAIDRYLWDPARRRYSDYQWRRRERLDRPSAAALYPLFVGLADERQAAGVAELVRTQLLAPGGLLATPRRTGQQWDAPNGWAPLQWIAVRGLQKSHHDALAAQIARRWLATVSRVYAATGKLLEKYDVLQSVPGGGGEYPTQDGFGWTNGVTRELLDEFSPEPKGVVGSLPGTQEN